MNAQASRHRGIEARNDRTPLAASRRRAEQCRACFRPRLFRGQDVFRGRGFSLIEVLLAIFILGIGIISIAALFPAGIAQQRLSNDDLMGPIVANHAISVLRSKLRPEQFGVFEHFMDLDGDGFNDFARYDMDWPRYTIPHDWDWMRPGILLEDDVNTTRFNEQGALDVFSHRRVRNVKGQLPTLRGASELFEGWVPAFGGGAPVLYGIPFNWAWRWDVNSTDIIPTPPLVIITQGERYYPMQQEVGPGSGPNVPRLEQRPQYVWECMFRRYEGRIHVAIFVYRVSVPGSAGSAYRTPPRPEEWSLPFLPYRLELDRPWGAGAGAPDTRINLPNGTQTEGTWILGTSANTYDPRNNLFDAWQEPRQWLLDQNNNVHRVLGNRRSPTNAMQIELARGVEPVLGWFDTGVPGTNNLGRASGTPNWYKNVGVAPSPPALVYPNVVTDIWYLPREMQIDTSGNGVGDTWVTVTPVYITVKEL